MHAIWWVLPRTGGDDNKLEDEQLDAREGRHGKTATLSILWLIWGETHDRIFKELRIEYQKSNFSIVSFVSLGENTMLYRWSDLGRSNLYLDQTFVSLYD